MSSCKGQNVCDCSLLEKPFSFISYEEALYFNKRIIPCLIDSIDTPKISFVGFQNPINSYIGNYHFNQYGIKYAYLVDYVLSKDSIETVHKTWNDNEDFIHWSENTKPYRVYNVGVIVKQNINGKTTSEPLTHDDMVLIKKMYLEWWNKNKNKPIEIIRGEFRNGKKILQLPYIWI